PIRRRNRPAGTLIQAAVLVLDLRPSISIKGNAEHDLSRGHARIEIVLDGELNIEVIGAARILPGIEKWSLEIRGGFPGAVIVVRSDIQEIEEVAHFVQLDIGVVLRRGRGGNGQQIMTVVLLAKRVELFAEFAEQRGEILFVGCRREFPVNIEAVEQVGSGKTRRDVAVDEHIYAGRGQLRAQVRAGGDRRECGRICGRGSAQGNQDLEVRMKLLQLLQGGEIAV